MIRIGLPPPVLPRLRLHWHVTRTVFARHSRALLEVSNRTAEAYSAWWLHVSQRILAPLSLRDRARRRALARLAQFEAQYDELVDLLCWSAKDGVHTDRDTRYATARSWMLRNYPGIQSRLRPHWAEADPERDPFAALFASADVEAVINGCGGIDDMIRSRAALAACREDMERG